MTTTVLNQEIELVSIPEDLQCTIVMAADSTAIVQRISEEQVLESSSLSSGQTVVFGEYLIDVVLRISCLTGSLTYNVAQRTAASSIPQDGGSLGGVAGNLTVIDAGQSLTLIENAQSAVFGSLTVNGSYTVNGELRVQAWPT